MEHCGLIIPFWEKALISDTKNLVDHLLELMHGATRDFSLLHMHQRLPSKIFQDFTLLFTYISIYVLRI